MSGHATNATSIMQLSTTCRTELSSVTKPILSPGFLYELIPTGLNTKPIKLRMNRLAWLTNIRHNGGKVGGIPMYTASAMLTRHRRSMGFLE